ncbi:MAG: Serine protease, subtilase family [uncultured Rubrobacteraceae bacterium]|uniref:Serine protease, subtilase family n=1 Tax=uncultured Rubrobacteraceae bacterium TaxID=349277 RepID=A0A6J4QQW1_9ACTN|nr:MAG: Serine protease, subtilase family [uncultured Rubrobacteraceae bacterium]
MRNCVGFLIAAAAVLLIGLGAQPEQAISQPSERASEASAPKTPGKSSFAPDQILVKAKEGASAEAVESINRKNNASTKKKIPRTKVSVVKLPKALSVEEAIDLYEASSEIEYAEPDFIVKPSQTTSANDPDYPKLYGLNNTGQTSGTADADIDAPEAWYTTSGNANTVVAVIDEGVDINHGDLKDNVWTNPGETAGNKIDDDKNGYVDDVNGYDFYNNDATVYDSGDGDKHGTHVVGTIAAQGNNSLGVVGVNWKAKVMPLKFLGPNGGYISDAVEALNYAVAKGAKISNNSWGGGGYSQTMLDAINKADASGHLFVAAAGNDGRDNDSTPSYPASYDSANIISVAATDSKDSLASFSNYGSTSVDVAAPGASILSTLPDNTYGSYNGTSMATPHVSGVAALLKGMNSSADDATLKEQILKSVDAKSNLSGKMVSGGRSNAAQATKQSDTTAPVAETPAQSFVTPSTLGTSAVPVKLTWSATDNTDGSGIASYQLQQSVNGGTYSNVTLPSATTTTITPSLTPTYTYRFRVAAKDKVGNVSDWAYGPSFKVNAYQENATAVTYPSGTWTRAYLSGAYGSYVKYAKTSGARTKLSFTGRNVAWIAPKSSTRGKAEVYVDGTYVQTVDLYSSSTLARQVVFSKSWATSESHSLEVRVLGTSGRPMVDVDAFMVLQ